MTREELFVNEVEFKKAKRIGGKNPGSEMRLKAIAEDKKFERMDQIRQEMREKRERKEQRHDNPLNPNEFKAKKS